MQNKKLHLSKEHRMIAGVCGGLAEYFETDPAIIRIIFVFFTFMGAASIFVYVVLWLFLGHKKDHVEMENEIFVKGRYPDHGQGIIGFFLIITGVLLLADNLFPGYGIRTFWPILIVFLGLALMLRKHRQ